MVETLANFKSYIQMNSYSIIGLPETEANSALPTTIVISLLFARKIMWYSVLERKRERSFLPNGCICSLTVLSLIVMSLQIHGGVQLKFYNWEDLCEVEVELPLLCVQQKYVDIYNAMVANQQAYERGLEDLKLTCDGYIEDLRRKMPCEKIGPYLRPCNERNSNNAISLFQGVNVEHIFTAPKRVAEDCENGSIVRTGQFAFNRVMKSHNTKLPIALRDGPDCVVSSSYQVFEIVNVEVLMPQYLMLWMNRKETQRFAGYVSYGTTRDIFSFENMCDVQIPIPSIKVQKSIAEMYTVYNARKKINEQLKAQIKNICPILIRGSLEE